MSKLDGAIRELRTIQGRMELTGIGIDRLPDIDTALHFLEVAAGVNSARCLRAVKKGMGQWQTSGVVKVEMLDLFTALEGLDLPKKAEDE